MKFLKRPTFIFTLVIMGGFTVILVTSLTYEPITRALPLGVSVLGILLGLVLLGGEIMPNLGRKLDAGYFSTLKTKSAAPETASQSGKSLVITVGWVLLFFLLVVFFGFIIATAVSIFIYLKWYKGIPWLKSLLVSGASGLVIYVIFSLGMKLWLFPGIVFGGRMFY